MTDSSADETRHRAVPDANSDDTQLRWHPTGDGGVSSDAPVTPAFGAPMNPAFGTPPSPAFGAPTIGAPLTPVFGTPTVGSPPPPTVEPASPHPALTAGPHPASPLAPGGVPDSAQGTPAGSESAPDASAPAGPGVGAQVAATVGPLFSALSTRMRDTLAVAQDRLRTAGEESQRAEGLPPVNGSGPQWAPVSPTAPVEPRPTKGPGAGEPPTPPSPPVPFLVSHFSQATVIFFVIFTLLATIWAFHTATTPIDWSSPTYVVDESESALQSGLPQSAPPQAEPQAPEGPTVPTITSVQVVSWRDDQGDNETHAINMIDGDPETEWHSRQFDSAFGDNTGIAIVVKLDKPGPVSEVVLKMHESTQGGELFLTRTADNPRKGEILVTSAMSAETVLKLPQTEELDSFVLRFGAVPQAVDGAGWAWIYDIAVR